jgi:hypothetical protein
VKWTWEALEGRRGSLGNGHENTLSSAIALSELFEHLGRLKEAGPGTHYPPRLCTHCEPSFFWIMG